MTSTHFERNLFRAYLNYHSANYRINTLQLFDNYSDLLLNYLPIRLIRPNNAECRVSTSQINADSWKNDYFAEPTNYITEVEKFYFHKCYPDYL